MTQAQYRSAERQGDISYNSVGFSLRLCIILEGLLVEQCLLRLLCPLPHGSGSLRDARKDWEISS